MMTPRKKKTAHDQPVTQKDLELWGGQVTDRINRLETGLQDEIGEVKSEVEGLKSEMGGLKGEMGEMKSEMGEMKELLHRTVRVQEAMLKTLESIDGRLAAMGDHEERLVRLEDHVLQPRPRH